MNVIFARKFIDDSSEIVTSDILYNPNRGEELTLEVYGNATGFTLIVEGKIDTDNESTWTQLGWVNSIAETGTNITSNGIYIIPVQQIPSIRVRLSAITTGSLTAYGRVGE